MWPHGHMYAIVLDKIPPPPPPHVHPWVPAPPQWRKNISFSASSPPSSCIIIFCQHLPPPSEHDIDCEQPLWPMQINFTKMYRSVSCFLQCLDGEDTPDYLIISLNTSARVLIIIELTNKPIDLKYFRYSGQLNSLSTSFTTYLNKVGNKIIHGKTVLSIN